MKFQRKSPGARSKHAVVAVASIAAVIVWAASPALAQTVELTPTSEGLPGGEMVVKVVNWAGQYALFAILLGGMPMAVAQRRGR